MAGEQEEEKKERKGASEREGSAIHTFVDLFSGHTGDRCNTPATPSPDPSAKGRGCELASISVFRWIQEHLTPKLVSRRKIKFTQSKLQNSENMSRREGSELPGEEKGGFNDNQSYR